MVLFKNYILNTDKPISVDNLPPLKFSGGTKNKARTGKMQGDWYPEISVAVE